MNAFVIPYRVWNDNTTGIPEENSGAFGQVLIYASKVEEAYKEAEKFIIKENPQYQHYQMGDSYVENNSFKKIPEYRNTVFNNLDADITWIANYGLDWYDHKRKEFSQDSWNKFLGVGIYSPTQTVN